ncbi:MAG TPA: hypothetical protein VL286_07580 [Rhizomicrobium sp.]|jgi:hypothetical protein|nr:hypothetical protein [Rhizomicrobium sp.]
MKISISVLAAAAILGAATTAAVASSPSFRVIKPLFGVIPSNAPGHHAPKRPVTPLVQWNGSFTDHVGQTITYTMVGTDPSSSNSPTTIPVVIIPIKMVYGALNGNMTFDPKKTLTANGNTVLKDLQVSPLLRANVKFVQGGTNVGKTQYIDAFQRANFWSFVSTNTNYHVLLGSPTVLPEQTINVSPAAGSVMTNPFGTQPVGTMEIDLFDMELQNIISANANVITPDVLPLFLTTNVYLTEGVAVCCIGGYHSANGSQPDGQTYAYATYVTEPGTFSQDVSAWSHEIGEWMDDPFVDNSVNCADNNIMEDGDPLENNANYGAFPYVVKGRTYNLQSLVFLGYFGAPPDVSLHSWLSFQNDEQNVCPGQ